MCDQQQQTALLTTAADVLQGGFNRHYEQTTMRLGELQAFGANLLLAPL